MGTSKELSKITTKGIDLNDLPKSFCPCKPIAQDKTPKDVLDSKDTYGQRKHNGHCIIFVTDKNRNPRIFSRTMEDLTEFHKDIPFIKQFTDLMGKEQMVLTEAVFTNKATGLEEPRTIAKIVRKKNAAEALERFHEYSKTGTFKIIPFDIMFHDNIFMGDNPYTDRYKLLLNSGMPAPELIPNWKAFIDKAHKLGWEGMVLRFPGKDQIEYTLDGKAHKKGSWKFKFKQTDDFILVKGYKGKSGWQADVYAQFDIAQIYNGELQEFGRCGLGTIAQEAAIELTKEIESGKRKFGKIIVELEFDGRQEDSGKLLFPQIQRIRDDKKISECICEETFTDFEGE
jgi:ATP-dependent DNA ligase